MPSTKSANSFAIVKQASNADVAAEKTALAILSASYDAIVGTTAQVVAGIATHDSLQNAINYVPSEGRILFLGVSITENVTVDKIVAVDGKGHGSKLNGTMAFTSNANYCLIKDFRISDNVTFNLGANANYFINMWLAPTKTVTDGGVANSIVYIQE